MICEKCQGTGTLTTLKPVSLTSVEEIITPCDLCGGTGELPEDLTPLILQRLDRIIELLEAKQ